MNCIGHSEIRLFRDADMNKYIDIPSFNQTMLSITGHDYIRDCLKYYDMIMLFDNSLPYEFYSEEIKSIDMVPFDVFYNKEMSIHEEELSKKNHIKLRTVIERLWGTIMILFNDEQEKLISEAIDWYNNSSESW